MPSMTNKTLRIRKAIRKATPCEANQNGVLTPFARAGLANVVDTLWNEISFKRPPLLKLNDSGPGQNDEKEKIASAEHSQ